MKIDVYADSTGLFTQSFVNRMDNNMITIEVDEEIVYDYFKENCLYYFRTDVDEGLSDRAVFEEWLEEYTCDDTDGLYKYVVKQMNGDAPIIDEIWR